MLRHCNVSNVFSPFVNDSSHVLRQLAGEVHLLPCGRMDKTQSAGMKHLPRTELKAVLYERLVCRRTFTSQYLSTTIALVAEQRMTDMLHVSTYLMRTTRLQPALNKRGVSKAL